GLHKGDQAFTNALKPSRSLSCRVFENSPKRKPIVSTASCWVGSPEEELVPFPNVSNTPDSRVAYAKIPKAAPRNGRTRKAGAIRILKYCFFLASSVFLAPSAVGAACTLPVSA